MDVTINKWAIQLLKLGHCYGVQSLMDQCVDYLAKNMVAENALEAIAVAHDFGMEGLVVFCGDFIHRNRSKAELTVRNIMSATPPDLAEKILETSWAS